jgi:transaldolase / glucose-6-phosphate isomerase
MNPLKSLTQYGQAVWLDFLARDFVAKGGLATLIERDGLSGVTSNPAIFEKAIDAGGDYLSALEAAERTGDFAPIDLYEQLAVADIQSAADVLRPVYDTTGRRDGFVSLEVSPYLALDTAGTIAEARRLWRWVGRDNLMIKVPGTPAGLPAIRQLLGEGININITLLFSQNVYEEVVEAYLAGLERFVAGGGDPSRLASVASFFVSRIDSAVDKLIEARLKDASGAARGILEGLRGKVAIANAKLAYQRFNRRFAGARWEALRAKGARVQRLLWASTGTKNPAYRDVLYVEELIGPDTVNTMPPATMDAFRDHGKPRASLEENVDEAERLMAALDRVGISIDQVTESLVHDGVRLFGDAADKLLGTVARKRIGFLGDKLDRQSAMLPEALEDELAETLEAWRQEGNVRRLWARDARLWTGTDEAAWLGWLDIVDKEWKRLDELTAFREEVKREGFNHVLLLGMGGSSLGPEVFAETFGRQPGFPELLVLDSTDPAQIRAFERRIDPARTLFIVSSKSGTTLEPNILKQYFFERAKAAVGAGQVGSRFIAITDPGSKLEEVARRAGFRRVFFGLPSIGGRYSVLSDFGLAPAATMGLDLRRVLAATQIMVRSCHSSAPAAENPGVELGAILGLAAQAGRDKVTIVTSPGIADFGAWLEQLIAESTGKRGRGLIPVDEEPLGPPEVYGQDRMFVHMRLADEQDAAQQQALVALEREGHPVVRIVIADRYHIGQEFFRWEFATAVAGAIIGINPFDQPDVEASKIRTRELTAAVEKTGHLPPEEPIAQDGDIKLFADGRNADALLGIAKEKNLAGILKAHLARLRPGDYAALLAFIERNTRHQEALQELRTMIRDKKRVATCVGFGPRFLHSTGQAYKGGPPTGVFLQITCDDAQDLPVPGQKYSFGVVKAAQARGDFDVLAERGRRALRIHLGADVAAGLATLTEAIRRVLA